MYTLYPNNSREKRVFRLIQGRTVSVPSKSQRSSNKLEFCIEYVFQLSEIKLRVIYKNFVIKKSPVNQEMDGTMISFMDNAAKRKKVQPRIIVVRLFRVTGSFKLNSSSTTSSTKNLIRNSRKDTDTTTLQVRFESKVRSAPCVMFEYMLLHNAANVSAAKKLVITNLLLGCIEQIPNSC